MSCTHIISYWYYLLKKKTLQRYTKQSTKILNDKQMFSISFKLPLGPLWYFFDPRCTMKILWSWHFLQVFYSTTDNFLWWWVHLSLSTSSSCISNLKSRNKEGETDLQHSLAIIWVSNQSCENCSYLNPCWKWLNLSRYILFV